MARGGRVEDEGRRPVTLEARIERKHPKLPGYVVVPAAAVARWGLTGTTTVEGTLDGRDLGRRSLKRWDDDRWFLELSRPLLAASRKDVGDAVTLVLTVAAADLPDELRTLLEADADARRRWEARTEAQRRMIREDVLAARTTATRAKRARQALFPPEAAPAPVEGLPAAWTAVQLRLEADQLPGATCGPYTGVRVGLQVGHEGEAFVPGDADEARWTTPIEVRARPEGPAFRGAAVHGPARERFVYLTWRARKDGGPDETFRRAKLRLDAVPLPVLVAAVRAGALVGRLGLTAPDGMPVCASVTPPWIGWSAG